MFKKLFKVFALIKIFLYRALSRRGKIHPVYIRYVKRFAGYDKFPTGSNSIFARVFRCITELYKTGDNYVIITILRKSKAFFCKLACKLQPIDRSISINTEIYFRVNKTKLHRRFYTKLRELIISVPALYISSAKYHTHTVIAFLNSVINVGVEVKCYEEILKGFKKLFLADSACKIRFKVRKHIFVKSAQCNMIVAIATKRILYKFHKNASLLKSLSRFVRYNTKRTIKFFVFVLFRALTVPIGNIECSLNTSECAFIKLSLLFICANLKLCLDSLCICVHSGRKSMRIINSYITNAHFVECSFAHPHWKCVIRAVKTKSVIFKQKRGFTLKSKAKKLGAHTQLRCSVGKYDGLL